MKKQTYEILVHESEEGGYWAECPALEGCYSQGETLDELKSNIKEAIELYIDELKSRKVKIRPEKRIFVMPVTV